VFNAHNIPFEDESFDAVVANHMLYHVPDLNGTLSEIRRVLKPAGKLYASTNGVNHMRELDELTSSYIPHKPVGQVIANFTLENGKVVLDHFFAGVELRKHDDSLVVTEVAPLVEYALSRSTIFAGRAQVDENKRQAFTEHVKVKMREQGGVIRITKDSGLFMASKR
jgi:SAM-dependent methyltransferase